MNQGKMKCALLRKVRKEIAEKYGLEYNPRECTYEGDCLGTCPYCDAELLDLKRQLEEKGITEIDELLSNEELLALLGKSPEEESIGISSNDEDCERPQRNISSKYDKRDRPPLMGDICQGDISFKAPVPLLECEIAGLNYKDLSDIWEELEEGTELVLIRDKNNKYDENAVALALVGDYDEDYDFDFRLALGYIPRTENQEIAKLLDGGYDLSCKITSISTRIQRRFSVIKISIDYKKNSGRDRHFKLRKAAFEVFFTYDIGNDKGEWASCIIDAYPEIVVSEFGMIEKQATAALFDLWETIPYEDSRTGISLKYCEWGEFFQGGDVAKKIYKELVKAKRELKRKSYKEISG